MIGEEYIIFEQNNSSRIHIIHLTDFDTASKAALNHFNNFMTILPNAHRRRAKKVMKNWAKGWSISGWGRDFTFEWSQDENNYVAFKVKDNRLSLKMKYIRLYDKAEIVVIIAPYCDYDY